MPSPIEHYLTQETPYVSAYVCHHLTLPPAVPVPTLGFTHRQRPVVVGVVFVTVVVLIDKNAHATDSTTATPWRATTKNGH
jgi:hypothetical protein